MNPHEEAPPPPQDGVSTNSTTSALEIFIYIKKIFLIERRERQKDYELSKESNIIDEYRKLAKKELKCERLDNNESLVEVVNRVYKSIFGDKIL